MVAEKVEGQIVQKMSFKFRLANHSDEPPKTRIVSAKASTIFEFHLHCTISELNTIFLIPVAGFTVLERRFFTRLD